MINALTDTQRRAIQEVVAAKIRLWEAAGEAERLLGRDIDTHAIDLLCGRLDKPADAYDVSDDDLIQSFDLSEDR